MVLPSKELLSEVLYGVKITSVNCYSANEKNIVFNYTEHYDKVFGKVAEAEEINIYELAHKCKEWAIEHKFEIMSNPAINAGGWAYVYEENCEVGEESFLCNEDTEPEAIFKACEWILQQKEMKR